MNIIAQNRTLHCENVINEEYGLKMRNLFCSVVCCLWCRESCFTIGLMLKLLNNISISHQESDISCIQSNIWGCRHGKSAKGNG